MQLPATTALLGVVALAGCSHPASAPAHAAASAPLPAEHVAKPSAAVEPDVPRGFVARVIDELPAPSASAAREDLPEGSGCRIGSARAPVLRDYGAVVFPSSERIVIEGLGRWQVLDAQSGRPGKALELGLTSGLSPSGTCVAARAGEDEVTFHRLPEGEVVARRKYSPDAIDGIVPADDCGSAMRPLGAQSRCVTLFDASLAPGELVCAKSAVQASVISGDGRRVALAPERAGVHVFDTATQDEIAVVATGPDGAYALALARDGSLLALADAQHVRVVAPPDDAVRVELALESHTRVRSLVFSPRGKRLAIALDNSDQPLRGAVMVVDVASGKPLFTQRGLPAIGAMAFSPDGKRLAHVVKTGVRVVDVFTGQELVAPARLFALEAAALSPAGDRAVTSSAGHLAVWDTGDCSRIATLPNRPMLDDLLVEPGGAAAYGFADEAVARVDLRDGSRTVLELGSIEARDSQALAPDGRTLVVGIEDARGRQSLVFVDARTMQELRRVTVPGVGPIGAVVFAEDGKRVLAIAAGGLAHGDMPTGATSVVEVDVARGNVGRRFTMPGAAQRYDAALLEHGRVIVINGELLDAKTGNELARMSSSLMAISDDQRTILWSDRDGVFAWPADEVLPASPARRPFAGFGRASVGVHAFMSCDDQSCVVWRTQP